jgi:hypothetical protein
MKTILILYLCSGGLLTALSLPLIFRKVKPNPLYGFRVAQTMDNPEVWYEVNAYSGVRLLVTGLLTILSAIGVYLIPGISLDTYALICLGVVGFFLIGGLIQCVLYLKKISARDDQR